MACGRFGFLVRLIELMAVVQNAAGSQTFHTPVHRQTGMLWRSGKNRVYFYLFIAFG